ncbi:Uncharacterized protein DAT39_014869 [Clarias magur]|uniref:Uncharacterized protein n=1 Tax=Clarias magur TaxID=1594786 RepID=A0A8J4TWB2_CLAMG|nr:Uncharacterized protein DAT39_014869 [Clarias magur]
MPVPFGTPQTGRLAGFFMTRRSGRLQHSIYACCNGVGEDKPNHNICVLSDSKSEKMIRLGFYVRCITERLSSGQATAGPSTADNKCSDNKCSVSQSREGKFSDRNFENCKRVNADCE